MGPNSAANPASVSTGGRSSGAGASRNSCTQCHFGTADYAVAMGNMGAGATPTNMTTLPDLGFDFPHSGRTTDIKLLGSYTINVPAGGFTPELREPAAARRRFDQPRPGDSISENNLDAVCLRCHPGVGVHQ